MALKVDTIAASAARTTTGTSATQGIVSDDNLTIGVNVTTVSGTSPSLALSVEWSLDGTVWSTGETPTTFAAITAVKSAMLRTPALAPYYRLKWTITGTTPSFTFEAKGYSARYA